MKRQKTLLSLLLIICMALQFAVPAFAEDTVNVTYIDENGVEQSHVCIKLASADGPVESFTFEAGGWYCVYGGGTFTVKNRVENNATADNPAHLILTARCVFNAEKGIHNPNGKGLVIYGEANATNPGTLCITQVESECAGIGGNLNQSGGMLTINGGSYNITAGAYAAGIGGGRYGSSGSVTINGGRIDVVSEANAAGIGGGESGHGNVTINGGTVNATGSLGAGIGGGFNGYGNVTINGGTVNAISKYSGSGIGNGYNYSGSNGVVSISGGTVIAQGGGFYTGGIYKPGAAIGLGGNNSGGCNVTITGGSVTANALTNYDIETGTGMLTVGKNASILGTINAPVNPEGKSTYLHHISNPDKETVYLNKEPLGIKIHGEDRLELFLFFPFESADQSYKLTTNRGGIYYIWNEDRISYSVTPGNLTYNGQEQELVTFSGNLTEGAEITYSLSQDGTYSGVIPTGKLPGVYTVWYKVKDNLGPDTPLCVKVTIGKAPLTIKANDKTIVYGDVPDNNGVSFTGFVAGEDESVLSGNPSYTYNYEQYGSVGIYEITPAGYTSDNYDISFEKGMLKVQKATLTASDFVIRNTGTIAYDGKAHTASVELKSGIIGAGSPSIKYTTDGENFVTEPKEIGEYRIYVACGEGDNFSATPENGFDSGEKITIVSTVAQKPISFAKNADTIYDLDYADKPYENALTNPNTGATVTYSSDTADVAEVDAVTGKVTVKKAGSAVITAKSEISGASPVYASYVLNILKKPVPLTAEMFSVSAENKVCDGTTAATVTASLTGEAGITVLVSGSFADAKAGTGKTVSYTITGISGEGAENYTMSAPITGTTTADITRAQASITMSDGSFDYSGAPIEYSATATVAGFSGNINSEIQYSYEEASGIETHSGLPTEPGIYTVTASVAENDYHTAASESKTVTIAKMSVTFTLGTLTFKYDGQKHPVSVSAVDKNGKKFTDFSVTYQNASYPESSDAPSDAGTYTVAITLGNSKNYSTTQGSVELKIEQIGQDNLSILGLPGTAVYGDKFTLTAEGGSGTGAVTWSSDNENVTIGADSGEVSVNGAVGTKVTVTAVKAADGNHAEMRASWSFVPQAKSVTFTLENLEQSFDSGAKSVKVTPSDENATYTVTYDGNASAPTAPGVYTVAVTANGNYSGAKYALFTVKTAQITGVSFTQNGGTYGTAIPDAEITGADDFTTALSYGASGNVKPTKAGNYTATLTISRENYETLVLTSDFTIAKAPLTVTPKNARRYVGEANPVVELTYAGWQYGEDESVLLGIPVPEFTANAQSPAGEYDISLKGGYAENYELVCGTAKLTVVDIPSDTPSGGGGGGGSPKPVEQEKEKTVSDCEKGTDCPITHFTDLKAEEWYHDGIHYCVEKGLMNGTSDKTFEPDGVTTRAQIVTILYRLEGEPKIKGENAFTDVEAGSWYERAVLWAQRNGIVSGYGDGLFGPDDAITREQTAVILHNYAEYRNLLPESEENAELSAFADAAEVSDWAETAINWAVSSGLMNGDNGRLLPQGEATRAEAATMLMRFCEMTAK